MMETREITLLRRRTRLNAYWIRRSRWLSLCVRSGAMHEADAAEARLVRCDAAIASVTAELATVRR